MGLLDKALKLPGISTYASSTSSVSDAAKTTAGFQVTGVASKIQEASRLAAASVGASAFSKVAAATPPLTALAAQTQLGQANALALLASDMVNQTLASQETALTPTPSASAVRRASGSQKINDDHLVKLAEVGGSRVVVFTVLPEIVEARTVQYEAVAPTQFPGAFQKYKGTDSVQWTINATLVARNSNEATLNLYYLNTLRGWTMPFFGQNTATEYTTKLGAPPPVLMLSGLRERVIGPVPVVITSLNWNWPRDVDYLPTDPNNTEEHGAAMASSDGRPIPFPAVMNIAIQCVESFSTEQFNRFSLSDYRNGNMSVAFNTTMLG